MESSIKLKVCGMRDPVNIDQVAQLGPDYLGFIFYPSSPRYVGDSFSIPQNLSAEVKRVGVFVNETVDVMKAHAGRLQLHALQLHGKETPAQCGDLKEAGIQVIKVFSVDDAFDFAITKPYRNVVDFFLFDTKGKYYGGNAKTFNWEKLKQYDQEIPFFLSGGLTPENVEEALSLKGMNLYALDVNSGVEDAPAVKNVEKIHSIKMYIDSIKIS